MEYLILETISRYKKDKKIIRSSQHEFTNGKSCLTNPLSFYNKTTSLTDQKRAVDIVYVDYSKAFDMVPCKILIYKLLMYGLGGQTVT